MSRSTRKGRDNCPNCGAPIDGETCAYCGTRFIDFSSMDVDKPFWMKIRHHGRVLTALVKLQEVDLEYPKPEYIDVFGDRITGLSFVSFRPIPEINMRMLIIEDKGVIYEEEMLK